MTLGFPDTRHSSVNKSKKNKNMLYCCRMLAPRPLLPVDVALAPSHKHSTKLVSAAVSIVWITTPGSWDGQAARAGSTRPAAFGYSRSVRGDHHYH